MKKVYLLLISVVIASILPAGVYAYTKTSQESVTITQTQVINDDVYIHSTDSVTIDGLVNGDVYVISGRVTIRGTVNGDVIAAGRLVEVTGVVSDDLRVAGNTISVTSAAKIGDSMSAAGSDISVSSDSTIGGGLQAAGAAVNLDGAVGRGAMIAGEDVNINGTVEGEVKAGTTTLNFGDNADINGKVQYRAAQDATVADGAELAFEPQRLQTNQPQAIGSLFSARIVGAMIGFAMAFVTGLAILLISKRHTRHAAKRITDNPGLAVAVGLLAVVAGVPLAIFMMTTLVGIPLGFITLALWGIGLYVAKIFTAVAVGDWVLRRGTSQKDAPNLFKALAIGLGIYYVLTIVPVLGFFVAFAATAAGLGALLTEAYRSITHAHKEA